MEGTSSPCFTAVDRLPIIHDPFHSNYNKDPKRQGLLESCPENIDDFLALYRHEEWSIQEFLECLEDSKPSRNMCAPSSEEFNVDCNFPQVELPSDSAISVPEPAASQSTIEVPRSPGAYTSYRDSIRAEIRRSQNRKSQQRYRENLKKSESLRVSHSRKHPPVIHNLDSTSSCQRLHRAMLAILGSIRRTEGRIFQR